MQGAKEDGKDPAQFVSIAVLIAYAVNDTKAMHRVTECMWYALASESDETRSAAAFDD